MNEHSLLYAEHDHLAATMHRCGHAWRLAFNEVLKPFGLTHLQWAVLHLVAEKPGLRQTELADLAGIEGPSLVRVLDGLERDGWLERRPDPEDRRAKKVFLQEKNDARLRDAQQVIRQVHEKAVMPLNEQERKQFMQFIEVITEGLSRFAP